MRAFLIFFAALCAVAALAGGIAVSQLGVDGVRAYLTSSGGASAKAPQRHPLTGVCDPKTGFGPGEPLCEQCLSEKRDDCYGPPGLRFACSDKASDKELQQDIGVVVKKLTDLQKKLEADEKKDDDFVVPNLKAGRCRAVLDYLQPRVKELEQLNVNGYTDALDSALVCLSKRHAKAQETAKKYTNPLHVEILKAEIISLGNAVTDLAEKTRNFNFQLKADKALSLYRSHISFCSDRG